MRPALRICVSVGAAALLFAGALLLLSPPRGNRPAESAAVRPPEPHEPLPPDPPLRVESQEARVSAPELPPRKLRPASAAAVAPGARPSGVRRPEGGHPSSALLDRVQIGREDVLKERGGVYGYNSRAYAATLLEDRVEVAAGRRLEARLSWSLEEIRMGKEVLVRGGPVKPEILEEERTAVYRRGDVEERYVLRRDACEQLFVLHALPAERGVIEVSGRIETRLTPPADGFRGPELSFTREGREEMRISKAVVKDAAGRELPLDLAWAQGRMRLAIPEDWVRSAALPIVVDPTIGGAFVVSPDLDNPDAGTYDVAYGYQRNEWFVVWAEPFGTLPNDFDVYGQRVAADGVLVGAAVAVGTTPGWDYTPSVAWSPTPAGRYFIAWSQASAPVASRIWTAGRILNDDATQNTGPFVISDPGEPGDSEGSPAVAFDGANFFVAFDRFKGATGAADLYGQFVTAAGVLTGPLVPIDADPYAAVFPEVAFGSGVYMITWKKSAADFSTPFSYVGRTMDPAGNLLAGIPTLIEGPTGVGGRDVSAGAGKFLASWVHSSGQVRAQFFDSAMNPLSGMFVVRADAGFATGGFVSLAFSPADSEWFAAHGGLGGDGEIYGNRITSAGSVLALERLTTSAPRDHFPHLSTNTVTNEILMVYGEGDSPPYRLLARRIATGPAKPELLFVVASTSLSGADLTVFDRLKAMGYAVRVKSASALAAADAAGKRLVVVSSTVSSTAVNAKLKTVSVPVLTWESSIYDTPDLGLTGPSTPAYYGTTASLTSIAIVDSAHPLAAGLSGTVVVTSPARPLSYGAPSAAAAKVATVVGNAAQAVIFGYEKGALLPAGFAAPARRIGFFMGDISAINLTADGWKLFEAAVQWGVGGSPGAPPPAAGLVATGGQGAVTLTWSAAQGADSYEVRRSYESGGPYSLVIDGLAGTTFTDTGLTNGRAYYYVVVAKAGTAAAAPSNEASATPGAAVGEALFVVGSVFLGDGDLAVEARLRALGYTVTVKNGSGAASSDAAGKALVVVSSTVDSGTVGDKFRTSSVPVVHWENKLHDNFGMTGLVEGTDYFKSAGETRIAILDAGHPLAAGLSGTVAAAASPSVFTWGKPGANAAKVGVLTTNSDFAVVFGYDAGVAMPGLAAPARRVGLFLEDLTAAVLTADGAKLVDAAILWAAGRSAGAPPGPANLAATAESNSVSLTWDAVPGAASYRVYRSTLAGQYGAPLATPASPSHVDATVSNGITYYYVVTALSDGNAESARSNEVAVTPGAPGASGNVLFVVGNLTLGPGDAAAKARLESLGYSVATLLHTAVVPSDAAGRDLVVVSSTVETWQMSDANRVGLAQAGVPILSWENRFYDDAGLALDLDSDRGTATGQSTLAIAAPGHPLAGGFSGTIAVATAPMTMSWARPIGSGTAAAVLSSNADRTAIFGFEKGAELLNGTSAPARRVGFFLENETATNLNANGWALFDAAVRWATGRSAGAPGAPTNLVATPSDRLVSLTWTAPAGAQTYTLKRAEQAGGPYAVLASGLGSASYADPAVVNGRTYYYVVSASNSGAEGPDSAEAMATPRDTTQPPLLRILLVVGPTGPGDQAVRTRLEALGYGVDVREVSAASPLQSGEETGKALVVVSSTVVSGHVGNALTAALVPVLTWEHALYNDLLMTLDTAGSHDKTSDQTSIDILGATHPLAAGLFGSVRVTTDAAATVSWGKPEGSASFVASLSGDPTKASIFAFEKAAPMAGGTPAPARRIGFFLEDGTAAALTTEGWRLFDAAVRWGVNVPLPVPPTGLSAVGCDQQVDLAWTAAPSASCYNVYRALSPTGPFSVRATGLVATSYGDAAANGTTYYYYVTSLNAAGESGPSNQASAMPRSGASDPEPPTNLRVAVYSGCIDVEWDAPTTCHVLGYKVFRRLADVEGASWVPLNPSGQLVRKTRFRDSGPNGPQNGIRYLYRVTTVSPP